MKIYHMLGAGCLALVFSFANAVVINNDLFVRNGGDINQSEITYRTAYMTLTEKSFSFEFLSVGSIPSCSATWIGDTADKKYMYVLTAAHCIAYSGEKGSTDIAFWDYSGQEIGKGGTYAVPPQRINNPDGFGGASTDIAILKLEKLRPIVDKAGKPIPAPVLNDLPDEVGKTVHFVGYGSWGTAKDGNQGGWFPDQGPRRAWGTSRVDGVWEMNHGIGAGFLATGNVYTARVAPGDSGSAWWQEENGRFYIIADTNGGSDLGSTGARVSAYKDWIKAVAPEVTWRSTPVPVPVYGCFHLRLVKGAWTWVRVPSIRTSNRCLSMNRCNVGRACYKWDVVK